MKLAKTKTKECHPDENVNISKILKANSQSFKYGFGVEFGDFLYDPNLRNANIAKRAILRATKRLEQMALKSNNPGGALLKARDLSKVADLVDTLLAKSIPRR